MADFSKSQECADCSATEAVWASINRGVVLCADCCSVHRSLGRYVSQVKRCDDRDWHPHTWAMVQSLSRHGANSVWEHTLIDPSGSRMSRKKPSHDDPVHPVKADFVRAKHHMFSFVAGETGEGEAASEELHASVRTDNLQTSLRLLCRGGDPNFYHKGRGSRPLHVAAGSGQAGQVELLMAWGGDATTGDDGGSTAAQVARAAGYLEISNRLEEVSYEVITRLLCYLHDRDTHTPPHTTPASGTLMAQAVYLTLSSDAEITARCAALSISPGSSSGASSMPSLVVARLETCPEKIGKGVRGAEAAVLQQLAADLFDEVERREHETQTCRGSSQRCTVPFLPVNPLWSSTRNQARQKLARLSEEEFCALVSDVLTEGKRRAVSCKPDLGNRQTTDDTHHYLSSCLSPAPTSSPKRSLTSVKSHNFTPPIVCKSPSDQIFCMPSPECSANSGLDGARGFLDEELFMSTSRRLELEADEIVQNCLSINAVHSNLDSSPDSHFSSLDKVGQGRGCSILSDSLLSRVDSLEGSYSGNYFNESRSPSVEQFHVQENQLVKALSHGTNGVSSFSENGERTLPSRNMHLSFKNKSRPSMMSKFKDTDDGRSEGIYPPLSPDYQPASAFYLGRTPMTRTDTDLTCRYSDYSNMESLYGGINPPLSPDPCVKDTPTPSSCYTTIHAKFPSGIDVDLSPVCSMDVASSTYVDLSSVRSGINPPLSRTTSRMEASSDFYGSLDYERPGLSGNDSIPRRVIGMDDEKNSDTYRSYDTVNISSDEEETCLQSCGIKSSKREYERAPLELDSVNAIDSPRVSTQSSERSGTTSGTTTAGSTGSVYQRPSNFAVQLSKSIRRKILGYNRKSDCSQNFVYKTSHSDAIKKSRSLPLDKNTIINCDLATNEKIFVEDDKNTKSKLARTLAFPLKYASQKRQSFSRAASRSQPTTPEMSRKHRIVQPATRERTSTNIFTNPRHVIRNSFSNHNGSNSPQPHSSMKSLFSSKDKTGGIKHISKPILPMDPLSSNFQRLTHSTKSLMTHRDMNFMRPLVRSPDYKPPIAPPLDNLASKYDKSALQFNSVKNTNSMIYPPFSPSIDNSPLSNPPQDLDLTGRFADDKSVNVTEKFTDDRNKSKSDCYDDGLVLEVCCKCRQNVADGLQHPSLWTLRKPLSSDVINKLRDLNVGKKRKPSREDCRMQ